MLFRKPLPSVLVSYVAGGVTSAILFSVIGRFTSPSLQDELHKYSEGATEVNLYSLTGRDVPLRNALQVAEGASGVMCLGGFSVEHVAVYSQVQENLAKAHGEHKGWHEWQELSFLANELDYPRQRPMRVQDIIEKRIHLLVKQMQNREGFTRVAQEIRKLDNAGR